MIPEPDILSKKNIHKGVWKVD